MTLVGETVVPDGDYFTTSMTHQLHCVVSLFHRPLHLSIYSHLTLNAQYMMGRVYSAVYSGNTKSVTHDYNSHFYHCIDYLRQSIMCAGDLALELHKPDDPDDLTLFDSSWRAQHGMSYTERSMERIDEQSLWY